MALEIDSVRAHAERRVSASHTHEASQDTDLRVSSSAGIGSSPVCKRLSVGTRLLAVSKPPTSLQDCGPLLVIFYFLFHVI